MNPRYLVALDQGTTSSRAVIFNLEGQIIASASYEFPQLYPNPGWVEHNPVDILTTQIEALRTAVRKAEIRPAEIAAIGITNQRETTLIWDRETGKCVYNAIVWQCRRTTTMVEEIVANGYADTIRQKTGLVPDAYFSGSKIKWILDHLALHEEAKKGNLCFGTIDSFLCWNMVKGHPHVTDATNAGRTMLFNLHTQEWDDELLNIFDIPKEILPKVVDSAEVIGMLSEDILGVEIPIAAIAGDQHAALFGQACFEKGMAKSTYGTGCFLLMNIGEKFKLSKNNLLTTIAWRIGGKTTYALEGSVFIGGASVQWLRDEMQFIEHAADSEQIALQTKDNNGVYLVPAFTGLGAPHWNMHARGMIVGLTRGSNYSHVVRATLESIAYQASDLLEVMTNDCGEKQETLRVDGGASANKFLMQFQADIMQIPVELPAILETTALGVALMAGLSIGVFKDINDTANGWHIQDTFVPQMPVEEKNRLLKGWKRAVRAAIAWGEDEQ